MEQSETVGECRAAIAQTEQAVPITMHGTRQHHAEDRKVHALIRLMLQDFEQSHGVQAAERLRQQLIDLVRTELFPGDEIADLGNGQLCILLRSRRHQHVLFVAQSLQYFLQDPTLQGEGYNVAVSVTFFSGMADLFYAKPFCNARNRAAEKARRPADTTHRVTILSNDDGLALRLQNSLSELQVNILHVETMDQANLLIDFGFSDLTIVDVNGTDAWPGLVFEYFHNEARHHRILMLCGDADETSHYRERSHHAIDVHRLDFVSSSRFPDLVHQILTSRPVVDEASSEKMIGLVEKGAGRPSLSGPSKDAEVAA